MQLMRISFHTSEILLAQFKTEIGKASPEFVRDITQYYEISKVLPELPGINDTNEKKPFHVTVTACHLYLAAMRRHW